MLKGLRLELRWLLSLSNRLIHVVPGFTLSTVVLTLVSQFSQLLAFLLPLKVILLLGSDTIPHYFPAFLKIFDRKILILGLCGFSILLFLLHLLSEKLISVFVASGSRHLLSRSRKMVLFENQDDIAAKAYQRFSRGLASLVFLIVFTPVLIWLNPFLSAAFLTVILLSVLGCFLLACLKENFRENWLKHGPKIANVFSGLGFMLCFSYMVAEFLWLEAPSVLFAVICLLLLRQLFRHLINSHNESLSLLEKRRQLAALFFHGQRLVDPTESGVDGVWSLTEPSVRDTWLEQVIIEVTGRSFKIKSVCWLQLGLGDVIAYRVVAAEDDFDNYFFVKVYDYNRSALAKHEASLLVAQKGLPTLELLGVSDIGGRFHCHVFSLDSARQALGKNLPLRCEVARSNLLACSPNEEIKALFQRSKPSLAQRMNKDILKRLRCLLDKEEHLDALDLFEQEFEAIREMIAGLPMVYVNPDIRRGLVMLDDFSQVLVCHWARWSLEPVGSGWPIDQRSFSALERAHADAQALRADMSNVTLEHLKLVAVLFAFEKSCKQQDYHAGADCLVMINDIYAKIKAV